MQTTETIEHYGKCVLWKLGGKILKKYSLLWAKNDGRQNYISGRKTLFAESLSTCKDKAIRLYGSLPVSIRRV